MASAIVLQFPDSRVFRTAVEQEEFTEWLNRPSSPPDEDDLFMTFVWRLEQMYERRRMGLE